MELLLPDPFLIIFSLLGLITFVLWIVALVSIMKNQFEGNNKLIWALLVIFLPILGTILYFAIGRRRTIKTL